MSSFRITKGFDVNLAGSPSREIEQKLNSGIVTVYPLEFEGIRQRLKIQEGDAVKRGTELLEDKHNEQFKLRSPAGGTIREIIRGERRFVEQIVIEVASEEQTESFGKYSTDQIEQASREELLNQLVTTGYLSLIRQRPFSRIADINAKPKSIFVNGMNTGPFHADADVVVEDDPGAFQTGLEVLRKLTDGPVHLCVAPEGSDNLKSARNVEIHTFTGPHPAGNTSVHISRVDPMVPTDIIWTIKAVDLVLIGRLFLDGVLPSSRIISLGGPGVKEEKCGHYRIRIGGELKTLMSECLAEGEQRVLNGDVFSGTKIGDDGCLRFLQSSITILPEGRERRLLGWTMPGFNLLSFSRTVASSWFGRRKKWGLNTSLNGGVRAMVLTGYYDKVMPLDIMVDFLVRAVLAGDLDEAIKLGILETDPEDFAVCEFVCPCKMELQEIIRKGLAGIEEEGI